MALKRPSGAAASPRFFSTIAGRRLRLQALVVAAAFALGYLVTMFVLFPAPIFSRDHAVPRVLDVGASEARATLEKQGFRVRIEDQQTDPVAPRGAVIWQDPPPGVVLAPNASVALVLSEGPPDVPVPDVAGFPRPLAERVLKAAGFVVGRLDTLPASGEAGIVVQSRPGPGVGRPARTAIDLVISSGPAELTVPSVIGRRLAEARDLIAAAGLSVGRVGGRVVPGQPVGIVVEQRPPGGTRSPRGAAMELVVTRSGS